MVDRHDEQKCWRVPVLIHRLGRDLTLQPIIAAPTVEEAEDRARTLYGNAFVSFAGLPFPNHVVYVQRNANDDA